VKNYTGLDDDAYWDMVDMEAEGARDLKASYTDQQECVDNCYSQCNSLSYNLVSKYNIARCVRVNDFSCLVHKVRRNGGLYVTKTVSVPLWGQNSRISDTMMLGKPIGGDSKLEAAKKCATAAGFASLDEYYELTSGDVAKERHERFRQALFAGQSRTAEAGSMITGMNIVFFPWETAGTKWDYNAPFFQCILDADRTHNGQNRYKKAADWIVPATVKDAECVCWKGCMEMGKENAFCRSLVASKSGILGKMGVKPSSGVAPSKLGSHIDGYGRAPGYEHEDERPKFPAKCHHRAK